jgi:uncharacterized membrane protein YphA (DoxX/SURF4 family)
MRDLAQVQLGMQAEIRLAKGSKAARTTACGALLIVGLLTRFAAIA